MAWSPAVDILLSQGLDWRDDFHPQPDVENMPKRILTTIWAVKVNTIAARHRFISPIWTI